MGFADRIERIVRNEDILDSMFHVTSTSRYPNVARISATPPFGSIAVGAEAISISFRVANTCPPEVYLPVVAIYEQMTPAIDARTYLVEGVEEVVRWPVFRDLYYAMFAEWKGGTESVGRYFFITNNLRPDTTYYLTIRAADPVHGSPPRDTTYAWQFRTARRDVTVNSESLTVELDGDPGGSAEMDFSFMAYTAPPVQLIGEARYPKTGRADIPDGRTISTPFPSFTKQNVGSSLLLQMEGEDDDGIIEEFFRGIDLSGTGFARPEQDPNSRRPFDRDQRGQRGGETYDRAWAQTWATLDEFSTWPGHSEWSFELFSGYYPIRYRHKVKVFVDVVLTAGPPNIIMRQYPELHPYGARAPGLDTLIP